MGFWDAILNVKASETSSYTTFPYLEIAKLTRMSQSHGRSGDTLGDKQIWHKSIQFLRKVSHVVFYLLVGSFTKSHVLCPKISISTPKCWTCLSSNVVLIFKMMPVTSQCFIMIFVGCHIGTWGGFIEWASHFRTTCSYQCGSYKYLDYGL